MNVETPVDQEKDLIIVVEVEITIIEEMIEEEDIAPLILEIEEEIEIENIMIEEDDLYPLRVHPDLLLNLNLDQTHHPVHLDLVEKIQSGKKI